MSGSASSMSIRCLTRKAGRPSCGAKRLTASSGAGTAGPTGTTAFMRTGCAARSTWYRASPRRRASDMNSCLYQGVLRHRRLQPKAHHFVYRLFMTLGSTSTNWTGCLRRASAATASAAAASVRRRLSAGRAAEGPGAEPAGEPDRLPPGGTRDAPDPAALLRLPF